MSPSTSASTQGSSAASRNPLRRRRWFLLLVALLLVLAAPRACPWEIPEDTPEVIEWGEAANPSRESKELRVLVWNLQKGQQDGLAQAYAELSQSADLVLLQEVQHGDQRVQPVLAKDSGRAWAYGLSFWLDGDRSTGLSTGARGPAVAHQLHRAPVREPLSRTPKLALASQLPWVPATATATAPLAELLVLNIHAINFRSAAALEEQLRAFAPSIEAHQGPVLFAGDFNTWSAGRTRVLQAFSARHELEAAWPLCADPPQCTEPPPPDGRTRSRVGWPLDQALVRGLRVSDTRVDPRRGASDHQALSLTIALP